MVRRRSVSWLLAAVVLALAALAHASPPDPTWIAGLYDNADFDDVVLKITSTVSVFDSQMHGDHGPVRSVIASGVPAAEMLVPFPGRSSDSIRAPPTA